MFKQANAKLMYDCTNTLILLLLLQLLLLIIIKTLFNQDAYLNTNTRRTIIRRKNTRTLQNIIIK